MKITKFRLSDISHENSVRFDSNYLNYIINKSDNDKIRLTDIYDVVDSFNQLYPTTEDFKYCQIGDVNSNGTCNPVIINFENQDISLNDYYKKIEKNDIFKPESGDILIAKVRPYLKKIVFINDNNKDVYFTKAFLCLRPKINPLLGYLMIIDNFINVINFSSRMGKGYPTINNNDLNQLFVSKTYYENILDKSTNILKEASKYLDEVYQLELNMTKQVDIINSKMDLLYNNNSTLSRGMTFGTQKNYLKGISYIKVSTNNIGKYDDNLRISFRSNNSETSNIIDTIKSIKFFRIKDIMDEIVKGVQPQYADDGIPVIKISNLKNEYIDDEFTEFASDEFIAKLPDNKFVKNKDIIICSIGKGSLGKTDIVEGEYNAIVSTDNYMLRIDKNKYNPYFLTYYLRSNYGLSQFEMQYTGATNQIHIYDYNIIDFLIPNIDMEEQNRIVNEIDKEYEKNKDNKNKIEKIFLSLYKLLRN